MTISSRVYESMRHLISSFQDPSESIFFGKCLGFSEYGAYINIVTHELNIYVYSKEEKHLKNIDILVFHLYIENLFSRQVKIITLCFGKRRERGSSRRGDSHHSIARRTAMRTMERVAGIQNDRQERRGFDSFHNNDEFASSYMASC